MPSVRELTAVYGNFMLNPRTGPGVCRTCFTFTDGYDRCFACAHAEQCLELVAPISYSVVREQLHHTLASYKRLSGDVARRLRAELAAVLWRHLAEHERCVASAAGVDAFELVSTVPSGDPVRDEHHPLRAIVGAHRRSDPHTARAAARAVGRRCAAARRSTAGGSGRAGRSRARRCS